MMGHRQVEQAALFYEFSLEKHIPLDHLLRSIDRFVELGDMSRELVPFYSSMGRPSIDPELMIRMLIIGYCFGIRSERRGTQFSEALAVLRLITSANFVAPGPEDLPASSSILHLVGHRPACTNIADHLG